jgi:hypothetical protein
MLTLVATLLLLQTMHKQCSSLIHLLCPPAVLLSVLQNDGMFATSLPAPTGLSSQQ